MFMRKLIYLLFSLAILLTLTSISFAYEASIVDTGNDVIVRVLTVCNQNCEGSSPTYSLYLEVRDFPDASVIDAGDLKVEVGSGSVFNEVSQDDSKKYVVINEITTPYFSVFYDDVNHLTYILYENATGLGVYKVKITLLRPINGQCGSANGGTFETAPASNLCSAGNASSVTGSTQTYTWDWTCYGINEGSSASCSANMKVNGQCGSANGGTFETAPASNLCSAGNASSVTGSGPWNWTCNGINSGSTASCSANKSAPTSPPGSPDIVNLSISGIPSSFEENQKATVSVKFSNNGTADVISNFTVRVFVNSNGGSSGTEVATWNISSLGIGETKTVSKEIYMPGACSIHAYCYYVAKVDADENITESDESNNIKKVISLRAR
jgi:hypothetical protein